MNTSFLSNSLVKRLRGFVKSVAFVLLTVFLLSIIQSVLIPNDAWPVSSWSRPRLESFRRLPNDSVDCVLLGTSHMGCGVSPIYLYRDYGITSYNLATSSQSIYTTRYLVEEVFQTQNPSVVVLDASSLFFDNTDESEKSITRTLACSCDLSAHLIAFLSMHNLLYSDLSNGNILDPEWYSLIDDNVMTFFSMCFPIVHYHGRWCEIEKNDFINCFSHERYAEFAMGAYMGSAVVDNGSSVEEMNNKASTIDVDDIQKDTISVIREIQAICDEHQCKLLLVKIPSVADPSVYSSAWTLPRYERMLEFVADTDIPYYDLLYDSDVAFDMHVDFLDGGGHLNANGSLKATDALGEYLLENGLANPRVENVYEDYLTMFRSEVEPVLSIQSETDFVKYLKLIDSLTDERYLYIISTKGCAGSGITDTEINQLNDTFGIDYYLENGESYVAIISNGRIIKEAKSSSGVSCDYSIDGLRTTVSSNFTDSSIEIEDVEYSQNYYGINIVVYDLKAELVVDSLAFDPVPVPRSIYRSRQLTDQLFSDYLIRYVDNMTYFY